MRAYVLRRLVLVFPTLLGILTLNFFIVQFAPGGPVEQALAKLRGFESSAALRISSNNSGDFGAETSSEYKGTRGLNPELIKKIKQEYGFDKPAWKRYLLLLGNYARFDLGTSLFNERRVSELIIEKLPVSISLGLWSTLLVYLISIPLGIAKATRNGSRFDSWSSTLIIVANAIPSFLFALLLLIFFAGGRYFDWFPLRGIVSADFDQLSLLGKIIDYFHHLTLPLIAMTIGGFAGLAILTKNSFLDQISAQYVLTARAKGVSERRVLYGHVFRNAMLIVIAGFPSALIGILFTSATLIEILFSLDGLGLLTYEAVINRDYPVFFGTLYIGALIGLFLGIVNDLMYHWIDPRINFETQKI